MQKITFIDTDRSKSITFNGNNITNTTSSHVIFENQSISTNTADNYVKIYRVVGYKF